MQQRHDHLDMWYLVCSVLTLARAGVFGRLPSCFLPLPGISPGRRGRTGVAGPCPRRRAGWEVDLRRSAFSYWGRGGLCVISFSKHFDLGITAYPCTQPTLAAWRARRRSSLSSFSSSIGTTRETRRFSPTVSSKTRGMSECALVSSYQQVQQQQPASDLLSIDIRLRRLSPLVLLLSITACPPKGPSERAGAPGGDMGK